MCLRTARFARDRLACGMDLHVVRFARAAGGLNFDLIVSKGAPLFRSECEAGRKFRKFYKLFRQIA